MTIIAAGRSQFIVWAESNLALEGSVFDTAGTRVYQLGPSSNTLFTGGTATGHTLTQLQQWRSYFVQAGTNITVPMSTLGFNNDPFDRFADFDTVLEITSADGVQGNITEPTSGLNFSAFGGDKFGFMLESTGSSLPASMQLRVSGADIALITFPDRYVGDTFTFYRKSTNVFYEDRIFANGIVNL